MRHPSLAKTLKGVPGARPAARRIWKVASYLLGFARRTVWRMDHVHSIFLGEYTRRTFPGKYAFGIILIPLLPLILIRRSQLGRWTRSQTREVTASGPPSGKPTVIMGIGTLGPGGSERQLTRLAVALKKNYKLDVHVITGSLKGNNEGFFVTELDESGIAIHHYSLSQETDSDGISNVRFGLSSLTRIIALTKQLDELSPDVVHCWLDHTNVELGFAALLAGVRRIILTVRSVPPFNFKFFEWTMKPLYQALAEQPSVTIVANSSIAAREYEQWLGLDSGSVVTIPNAIDDRVWTRTGSEPVGQAYFHGSKPTRFRVGGLMRLAEEKDPQLWIEVALTLYRKGVACDFILGGTGPLEVPLARLLDSVGHPDLVTFPGLVTDAAQFLASLDLLLSTSRAEGLPNVVIEAQCNGVFVVATDVGGTREAMVQGKTGLLVASRNASEIADAVELALESVELRRLARALGPQFTSRKFNLDAVTRQWLDVYFPVEQSSKSRIS